MILRRYQQRAVDQLYDWFRSNPTGNPVINMPGGSGKSVVIASIVQDALKNWPSTRVLMLVHSRELVAQNAEKLRAMWPGAPMGIYSAGLKRRDIGEPITYASIQSIHRHAEKLGHIDLCIVDEAHAISTAQKGTYRKLIAQLAEQNPAMRVIGFSASPYRMGAGYITDGEDPIFKDILDPVTIEELLRLGHLAPLRSKGTTKKLDSTGLKKSRGDFVSSEMQEKYNTSDNNESIAVEMISRASDRKHWLIFCSGIQHAQDFSETLNSMGVKSHFLTGKDNSAERDRKIKDFEYGVVQAMCNVGVLTTGYDFTALDCIAFLRSTQSPGLYLQCAVRGMRPHEGKQDCLVLDFAGVVEAHGPITAIRPPEKSGKGGGEAPSKVCDQCNEIVHAAAKICPSCGFEFPPPEANKSLVLRNDDIMGLSGKTMHVSEWNWREHTSGASGKTMLAVTYYGDLSDAPVTEYHCILHQGFAGQKAVRQFTEIAHFACADIQVKNDGNMLKQLSGIMNRAVKPTTIEYIKDGKFHRVVDRSWSNSNE